MNEAAVSTKIKARFKQLLPGAVIFKHNDRTSRGVPDMSLNYMGRMMWFETKYIGIEESVSQINKHFDKVQLQIALNLGPQHTYLVATHMKEGLFLAAMLPSMVVKFLEQQLRMSSILNLSWDFGRFDQVIENLADKFKGEKVDALLTMHRFVVGPPRG
jgi:hypothetical protein